MDLEGTLESFPPTLVLQMLQQSGSTGELKLRTARSWASLYFENGCLVFATASERTPLGEQLLLQNRICREDLNRVLRKKSRDQRLGSALTRAGLIRPDELQREVRAQIEKVVFRVVRWTRGTFSFVRDRLAEAEDIRIERPLDQLLLEAVCRFDESGRASA